MARVKPRGWISSAFALASMCATISPAIACSPSFVAFEDGGAKLNAIDRASVTAFAHEARMLRYASIELVAQNDGSHAGRVMSQRRASSVRTELMRSGIPADSIKIQIASPATRLISGAGSARFVVMRPRPARAGATGTTPGC